MNERKGNQKTVNIRLEGGLWTTCKGIAEERRVSFNQFVEEALRTAATEERRSKVRAAFRNLAQQNNSVDFAFEAQSEAVLGEHLPPDS